jgi:hypothetical protein
MKRGVIILLGVLILIFIGRDRNPVTGIPVNFRLVVMEMPSAMMATGLVGIEYRSDFSSKQIPPEFVPVVEEGHSFSGTGASPLLFLPDRGIANLLLTDIPPPVV